MEVARGDKLYVREVSHGGLERGVEGTVKEVMGMGCRIDVSNGKGRKHRLVPWSHLGRTDQGPWGKKYIYSNNGRKVKRSEKKEKVELPRLVISAPPPPVKKQSALERKASEALGQDVQLDEEGGAYIKYTPDLAAALLEKSEGRNLRRLEERRINMYMQAMERELWSPRSATPIMLDTEMYLANGQHRLWAVFRVGLAIKMYTIFGATAKELRYGTDGEKPRGQALCLSLSKDTIAVLNSIRKYGGAPGDKGPIGNSEQELYLKYYQSTLDWYENIPASTAGKKLTKRNALFKAVVVRARHAGVSKELLTAFVQKVRRDPLTSGATISDVQSAAVDKLAQYLQSTGSSSEEVRVDKTRRIEWILIKFLQNEPVAKICANQNPIWPAPLGFDAEGNPLKGST